MSKRLAIIDHSFHQTTLSTKFIPELLAASYEVKQYWDTSWQGKKNVSVTELNQSRYDVIVFVQTILPIVELRQLRSKIVWIPMYDSVPIDNAGYWLELSTLPIKVISFSKTLNQALQQYGIATLPLQFYFNPADLPQTKDYSRLRVFFWQRTDITFEQVRRLFQNLPVERWILKINPDPNHQPKLPSPADCARYNITVVTEGYSDKASYLKLLQQSNVYICPRAYEGIGMSFLEAMAIGLVPIALNHPTMNEYIHHGRTGILVERFAPLAPFDLAALGQAVHQSSQTGYKQWLQDQNLILPFLQTPAPTARPLTLGVWIKSRWLNLLYYGGLTWKRLFDDTI